MFFTPRLRKCVATSPVHTLAALAAVAVLAAPGVAPGADGPGTGVAAAAPDIPRLIEQLGSDHYVVRQRAEQELSHLGIEAFDGLKAAEDDQDVEIAARASYLTQRIVIPWTQEGDPVEVKRILRGYDEADSDDRLRRILALASLAGDAGVEGLCRLARYENSPLLSKFAALTLLETYPAIFSTGAAPADEAQRLGSLVAGTLGASQRPAAEWIRAALLAGEDPDKAMARWKELVEREERLLAAHPERSRPKLLLSLLKRQAELYQRLHQQGEAVAVMLKMVEMEPDPSDSLVELVEWLAAEKAYPLIDELAERYANRFRSRSILLYMLAQVRSEQGKASQAEQIASEAFQLGGDTPEKHYEAADRLERQGLFAWAEREYRHVVSAGPATSRIALWASNRLSLMLHDLERDLEAAQVLKAAVDAIDKVLAQRGLAPRGGDGRQRVRDSLRARMEYYLAEHAARQNNWQQHRQHLDRAAKYDPLDADVLIAMYHLADADDAYRQKVRALIEAAAERFRQEIRDDPTDAKAYNQLAWLISNTEGDFDEALRASKESLRLEPGLAGYLDTLAHCFFAQGDFANAVRVQTRAARLEPHTQAIVRKLEVFQQALQKTSAAAGGQP